MEQQIRVLVVDDQSHTRRSLEAALALVPEVQVVGQGANGQEAVQFVAQSRPDVVLTDVRMPVMDGLEATRLIKSRWPQVRVIVLTMYATYQAEALAAGADAFLIKDGGIEELRDAIVGHDERRE